MVRQVRLNYGTFKIAIYDAIGYYVIYGCGCIFSYSRWFIYFWYHIKFILIFSISIDRDSISSQFMLKSLRSLYKSESRINITIPPPWRLFLIWCTGMYPSNLNKELWLILLSFAHVSVRQIILNLVFKDL